MDYSRDGLSQRRRELKSVSKRMYSKVMVNVFRIAVIAVVIVAILGT